MTSTTRELSAFRSTTGLRESTVARHGAQQGERQELHVAAILVRLHVDHRRYQLWRVEVFLDTEMVLLCKEAADQHEQRFEVSQVSVYVVQAEIPFYLSDQSQVIRFFVVDVLYVL